MHVFRSKNILRTRGTVSRGFKITPAFSLTFKLVNKTRGFQEPVITHMVFGLTSKVKKKQDQYRVWTCVAAKHSSNVCIF